VCPNRNPKILPPSSCVNPTHVASSSNFVNIAHVASSSCVNLTHVESSSYVDLNNVAFSTIVPNPKGKNQLLMTLQSFLTFLIQSQRNEITITLGNFWIHGLLSYLG
jgi:hypothetical protein